MEITYKLIKNGEKPEEIEIEKSGSVHSFTLATVREQLAQIEKQTKELVAQKELEDAKMVNYKSFHPIIETLSEEQINAVGLYYEAFKISKYCANKIANMKKAVEDFEIEKVEIEKQTGVKI